jgi:hypothetical protein
MPKNFLLLFTVPVTDSGKQDRRGVSVANALGIHYEKHVDTASTWMFLY